MSELKHHLTHSDCQVLASNLVDRVSEARRRPTHPDQFRIYGVPRGGVSAAYLVSSALWQRDWPHVLVDDPEKADLFVDDLVDSGATKRRFAKMFPGVPFEALHTKVAGDPWVVFPWENTADQGADDIALRLLQFVGEDPTRGGLAETPARFAKAWKFWTKGYGEDPAAILKTFDDGSESYDQMVLVRDIPVYSHCEHHLAPIFGVAHVAYIPDGKIVGLSKLNRLVDCFGRRLQVQERLTVDIADSLVKALQPRGVAVQLRCRHMCMESRGVCQTGHTTVTTALRGVFSDDPSAKQEFLHQCTV